MRGKGIFRRLLCVKFINLQRHILVSQNERKTTTMKKLLLLLTISLLILQVGHSQTNVSGGIFSNTTWTKVNSPYILTANVVVFPGVVLTIQPGVAVKFSNGTQLEIRQAQLIANGTNADSITFTSNSSAPTPGIYDGIYLNEGNLFSSFNYCNFKYANNVISGGNSTTFYPLSVNNSIIKSNVNGFVCYLHLNIDSCVIKNNSTGIFTTCTVTNCNVSNNLKGIYSDNNATHGICAITNCIVDSNQVGISSGNIVSNCIIRYNQKGINFAGTVDSCTIKYNQIGGYMDGGPGEIKNSIIDSNVVVGIRSYGGQSRANNIINCQIRYNGIGIVDSFCVGSVIKKNNIENNNIGIKLHTYQDSIYCNRICYNTTNDLKYLVNINTNSVKKNYWCTPDSTSTETVIYDGYDNINYGLVSFMPIDSLCAPSSPTSLTEITQTSFLRIFPNPFPSLTTLQTNSSFQNATLTVTNCFGQTVAQIKNINGQTITFSREDLPSGLYFVRLSEEDEIIAVDKLVITDK